ncbi:hypothetical protein HYE67_007997 [Fusarium culmorum]|uniref:Uncharacterized protein n=1 Tax=Fusarium culmorum TaxID=5516 RepID=A0A2T4GRC9_FUSCU|nr:hypothetical protein FCULG_00012379 [Fusarium culmorum]QPC65766.1 hypothetical protein HYE67_007997 [Fusarium culmorum]
MNSEFLSHPIPSQNHLKTTLNPPFNMYFSSLVAALAVGAFAAPTPQLKVEAVNDLVDVDSDNLAGLSTLLKGLGVTADPVKVLTPIGPGAKEKRQLKVEAVNDLVDVDSDNLAGLSTLLKGLGVTIPAKVLTPIGPGAKREAEAEQA